MRPVSGHLVSSEAEVKSRSRRQGGGYEITVGGQTLAEIESLFVKVDLPGVKRARSTIITFLDGSRWLIGTGPPDRTVVFPQRKRSTVRERMKGVEERVVRVIDERHERLLASARWPDRKTQRRLIRESMTEHGPKPLELIAGWVLQLGSTAAEVTVGDESLWYVPVHVPGQFAYGSRLGDSLTVVSHWNAMTLRPDKPTPLEAALLCWHLEVGDLPKQMT